MSTVKDYSAFESHQIIFYGAPGTGKSFKIKQFLIDTNVPKENIFRTTFHPDSDYSTFVGAYKPTKHKQPLYGLFGDKTIRLKNDQGEDLSEDIITYNFIPQAFLNAYVRAYQTDEKVYLVIEEINRGNCAQIFGDLFQLLDRNEKTAESDFTIKADADIRTYLEGKLGAGHAGIEDGELCLPANLYIYATMNTSDQSLFPIDSAFKRRWDWEYEPIQYGNKDWYIDIAGKKYSWVSFQQIVNDHIFNDTHSEDKMLGDFFVKPLDKKVVTEKMLVNKVLFYLWNDVCKDGDGDIFKLADGQDVSFSKLYGVKHEEKLIGIMTHLGVKLFEEVDYPQKDSTDNNDNSESSEQEDKDRSRYKINDDDNNGKGYSKGSTVFYAIKYYSDRHPLLTAQKVMDDWLALDIKISNLIETIDVYNKRISNTKDNKIEEKSKVLILNNGEELRISNQLNPTRMHDFIQKVNATDWNITISKIE